jgi:hypothetical protein
MHAHTGGVKQLSSSTGDARRVEGVVVLAARIAGEAFHKALDIAPVMHVDETRGTPGEVIGGVCRGRRVGLEEVVEPGGAPASPCPLKVFVNSSSKHKRAGSGSRNSKLTHLAQSQARAPGGGALTANGTWPLQTRPGPSQEFPRSRWRETTTQTTQRNAAGPR